VDLSAAEIRVLGCLLEKQRTTPDAYPLTLNALRAACNQTTSREPIVSYDDDLIRDTLRRLGHRRFTRLASGARAPKYRHLLDEALPMSEAERAVMTVMMLRGPQTLNELRTRTERMHTFGSPEEVVATLDGLAARGLAEHVGRRPGQKEDRWRELLGAEAEEEPAAEPAANDWAPPPTPVPHTPPPAAPAPPPPPVPDERVERLEREVAALRAELDELKTQLGVS
jgi:uncharacterized protein YceH (UPF0502 family)